MKPKVLLITREPVGKNMNAMGIRYSEFAKYLSRNYTVTLIAPHHDSSFVCEGFTFLDYSAHNLISAIRRTDVIVAANPRPLVIAAKILFRKLLVLDMYDPLIIEKLEKLGTLPVPKRRIAYLVFWDWLRMQMRHSDYYLCSNERQKDLYLGLLAASGKLNPDTYAYDANAKGLISIVGTGVSDVSPVTSRKVLRGVVAGIGPSDKLLLWVGAPNRWFDEELLLRVMKELGEKRPDIKLVFVCGHPEKNELLRKHIQLSDSLKLTGRNVFFVQKWVPFEEMTDYYLEADIGMSLHHCHLETRYSMRNRIMGYLWAHLPVIVTEGDTLAELVERNKWGIIVRENNKDELVSAILTLVDNNEYYQQCKRAVGDSLPAYHWSRIIMALKEAIDTARGNPVRGRIIALPGLLVSLMSFGYRFINCRIRCGPLNVWTGREQGKPCNSLS